MSELFPTSAVWPTDAWASVVPPALAVVGVVMGLTWFVALRRRDASVVDAMWSVGFVLLTFTAYAETQGRGAESRRVAVLALVTLWGLRLTLHLTMRHACEGEDRRSADLRARWAAGFAWKSLLFVFGLQGVLIFVIAAPVLAVMAAVPAQAPGAFDFAGAGVAALGLLIETAADRQLAAFKARPENQERVLDSGLWRLSRHPNYFGESLFWWGLALFGVSVGAPWALVSPVVLTVLLLRISGVALMERTIGARRPDYAAYVARTNAFVPGWPRRD